MATSESLPPGTSGLPLLGETLPFMKDMFGFIHARTQRHGPVFRSHILGTPTAFISGPEVCDRWLDENQVQREGPSRPPSRSSSVGPASFRCSTGRRTARASSW
jgi:hypothetical protein